MYGTQTKLGKQQAAKEFENDVNMYGTQTYTSSQNSHVRFENDVNMYGTQTAHVSISFTR